MRIMKWMESAVLAAGVMTCGVALATADGPGAGSDEAKQANAFAKAAESAPAADVATAEPAVLPARPALKVVKVDREEMFAEEGQGANAVDGDAGGDSEEDADEMAQLLEAKDWDGALTLVDEMQAEAAAPLDLARFLLLVLKKDDVAAMALAGKLGEKYADNTDFLNELAWTIATADGLKNRDLALAEKLAVRANELENEEDEAVLDTLARIKFMRSDKAGAIAIQQKTVTAAEAGDDDCMKARLAATLQSYQAGKLPSPEEANGEGNSLEERLADLLSEDGNEDGEGGDDADADGEGGAAKKIMLPAGGMVVVAKGDGEAESLGSYSIRLYAAEDQEHPCDDFLDGAVRPREGGSIEGVSVKDLDGDGTNDVIVTFRCVGTGSYLSADAFRVADKKLTFVASVADQAPNANVEKLLAFKLKPAAPGTTAWFDAVEAAVRVCDDEGHGPDIGSDEWKRAVDAKVFEDKDDDDAKAPKIGSMEWCEAVGRQLGLFGTEE